MYLYISLRNDKLVFDISISRYATKFPRQEVASTHTLLPVNISFYTFCIFYLFILFVLLLYSLFRYFSNVRLVCLFISLTTAWQIHVGIRYFEFSICNIVTETRDCFDTNLVASTYQICIFIFFFYNYFYNVRLLCLFMYLTLAWQISSEYFEFSIFNKVPETIIFFRHNPFCE